MSRRPSLMGRPSVLSPEHVSIVRELRNAHPGVGIGKLTELVARECGLAKAPSKTALHRFMQAHDVPRGGYRDVPTENAVRDLAMRALRIAHERHKQASPLAPEMARAEFIGNLSAAFHALAFMWAHEARVPMVEPIAASAREWLAEAAR